MSTELHHPIDCLKILDTCREQMNSIYPEPENGWAEYALGALSHCCFPREDGAPLPPGALRAVELYLSALVEARLSERSGRESDPLTDIDFLPYEAYRDSRVSVEYARLASTFERDHVMELLCLSQALRPYPILSHVALVHSAATTLAARAKACGIPVDVPLVSAAAASHDIGRFGCREEDALRIPFLHYYYTDTFLRSNGMPKIAHIASNHSTWDLELENLSAESLILIYTDFRSELLPSMKHGEVRFRSLADAYASILKGTPASDAATRKRYARVYRKLCDFEAYLTRCGVNCDVRSEAPVALEQRDPALLSNPEAVQTLRLLTVENNIRIMSELSSENTLSALLNKMRSADTRFDLRAFLAVLAEYHTYPSRQQKLMILRFLYELLMHREGDIRRDAGRLMGLILSGSSLAIKKELPSGAPREARAPALEEAVESRARLYETYLEMLLHPDHKISFKHRTRVMNSLKVVLYAAVSNVSNGEARRFMEPLISHLSDADDEVCFVVMDSLARLPLSVFTDAERLALVRQTEPRLSSQNRALAVASKRLIAAALRQPPSFDQQADPSELFLENLKAATHWIVKIDNIDALVALTAGDPAQAFHTAAHLSNLLRVSEHLPVREYAGNALIEVAKFLSPDQCNEIVVDLWRGLDSARYEITRYIPPCLGRLALMLPERELDETVDDLERQFRSADASTACMSLATLGVIFSESSGTARDERLLGLLMTGLAHDSSIVVQEAMRILGRMIFSSGALSLARRGAAFCRVAKKLLTLISERGDDDLLLYSRAAMLNHLYRFTTEYLVENGAFPFPPQKDVAFFPGAFDPFSTGHKGIVDAILKLNLEVYLAIDEFSWAKRTQPKLLRRRIAEMTVADRPDVYLFPDDQPVNIANAEDLLRLSKTFPDRNVIVVAGSDVIQHEPAYRALPKKHSIHGFDHIVFARNYGDAAEAGTYDAITGHVTQLSLPVYLEDVSSSRIRDSIDKNLDISTLVDPIVQRFIFDQGLYLRAPQYKSVLLPRAVNFHRFTATNTTLLRQIYAMTQGLDPKTFSARLTRHGENAVALYRDREEIPCGACFFHYAGATDLLSELESASLADRIRSRTSGRIAILDGVFAENGSKEGRYRLILTEALSAAVADSCAYALCRGFQNQKLEQALLAHGFLPVPDADDLFIVDMRFPIALLNDAKERLKEPLRSNARIVTAIETGSARLQNALTGLYPGELVLSFDSDVLYRQLIRRVTTANHVPFTPASPRRLGDYMCVPYGKILSDVVVPNTITKTLHADKRFFADLSSFEVAECTGYSPLKNQVQVLRSFRRDVLLVDDILHSGHRMEQLNPLFDGADVRIERVIVGILSGRGRDMMQLNSRSVESVYFIPNLRYWFTDSLLYPFIGGDSVRSERRSLHLQPSINLIYPYAAPRFIHGANRDGLYQLSETALENALAILLALENEHAYLFERSLTVGRLGEAVEWPRVPDRGSCLQYDESLPPSEYVRQDLKTLARMKRGCNEMPPYYRPVGG